MILPLNKDAVDGRSNLPHPRKQRPLIVSGVYNHSKGRVPCHIILE